MKITRDMLTRLFVLLFAAAAATGTLAQGPRASGGPGGPGGGPAPLAHLLLDASVHAALGLGATQEAQWVALQAAVLALRTQHDAERASLTALIESEFSGGAPDLLALEDAFIAQRQAMDAAMEAISAQATTLYASLTTGQQAIVVAAAVARYQSMPQP